jgi:hypothetical protein
LFFIVSFYLFEYEKKTEPIKTPPSHYTTN